VDGIGDTDLGWEYLNFRSLVMLRALRKSGFANGLKLQDRTLSCSDTIPALERDYADIVWANYNKG